MKQNRRTFLKTTALTAAATLASPLLASSKSTAGEDYKALVCVMLEGGADTANMLVPKHDLGAYLEYAKLRPKTAHNREQIRTLKESAYGFHPAMSRMQRLYNYGNLAVVANVGTLNRPLSKREIAKARGVEDISDAPQQLFSHVQQRELLMQAGEESKGWAARFADAFGTAEKLNVSVGGYNTMQEGGKQEALIAHDDIFGTHPMMQKVRSAQVDTFFDIDESTEGKSLGEQLQLVLDLIEHRKKGAFPKRQIFFVSHGGWDLHEGENARFDHQVAHLDKSMGEFYRALERLGLDKKVTTFTLSDFGRSIYNDGADHGWGGHAFVMGGAVQSGIYGKMPRLAQKGSDTLANGAIIPTLSVESYLAPMVAWLGDGKVDPKQIFPKLAAFESKPLQFLA